MSPTQRTLKMLREQGYLPAIVEHYNPHARFRQDLYGGIDVVGIHPEQRGVLGIQCTSGSNLPSRVAKLKKLEAMRTWLAAGNRLHVIGWRKLKRAKAWEPRVVALTLEDMA